MAFLALARIAFLSVPDFSWALAVLTLGGLSNGANAVATQSLRRKAATDTQFPEVVGLEIVVGRVTEWVTGTAAYVAIANGWATYAGGIEISAACLIVLAALHTSRQLTKLS